jgi:hypothetical protein
VSWCTATHLMHVPANPTSHLHPVLNSSLCIISQHSSISHLLSHMSHHLSHISHICACRFQSSTPSSLARALSDPSAYQSRKVSGKEWGSCFVLGALVAHQGGERDSQFLDVAAVFQEGGSPDCGLKSNSKPCQQEFDGSCLHNTATLLGSFQ